MTREQRLQLHGPVIAQAFRDQGFPIAWGLAFARQESDFDANAKALTGGDASRGGSWGLLMMSMRTAQQELRFTGLPEDLLDPETNCRLAARYLRILSTRYRTSDLSELAARYNSGHSLTKAPASTVETYVPNILRFVEEYQSLSFPQPPTGL